MTKRKVSAPRRWHIEWYPRRKVLVVGGGGSVRQRVIKCKLVMKFEREVENVEGR